MSTSARNQCRVGGSRINLLAQMLPPRNGPSPSASNCGSSNHTQYTVCVPSALFSCRARSLSQCPLIDTTLSGGAATVPVAAHAQKKSSATLTRSPAANPDTFRTPSTLFCPYSAGIVTCYIPSMLPIIDQLIRHKWWANTNLLRSIEPHPAAAEDAELRKLLHHILVANRYWLLLTKGQPFIDEEERRVPASHAALADQFHQTEQLELDWLSRATQSELDRQIHPRALPGTTVSVAEAMTQVALHSQGHRSQCATRLRALGGTPTPMDFVLWVCDQKV